MGTLLAAATGAPPEGGGFFESLGAVIASWGLSNIKAMPGSMVAAGPAVTGLGSFLVMGDTDDLGFQFATAVHATDEGNLVKWRVVASALVAHFNAYGQINPAGFVGGGVLSGAGTVQFSSMVFVPPLATQLGLNDPGNLLALSAFTASLLNHIKTNASVISLSISPPFVPFTGAGGPVTGSGSII
jgi:hypothetical protein